MSLGTSPTTSRTMFSRLTARQAGLGIAVLLLHVLMLDWVDGKIGITAGNRHDMVITAQFKTVPPPMAQAAPPAPKPVQPPKPKPRPKPAPAADASASRFSPVKADTSLSSMAAARSAEKPEGEFSSEPAADAKPAEASESPSASPPSSPSPSPAPSSSPAVSSTADATGTPAAHYKIDPPPSAVLSYDVQAMRQDQTLYGSGKLSWQSEGDRYVAGGEAKAIFITWLSFRSEGMIDEFGVAPVIYTEKGFNKSATNTHFHRERNTISFSASEASYPRKGGEQDRTSIIWQLVGIGRGDGAKFRPGGEFNVFVAGVRDGEAWRIQIIGQEAIETGAGRLDTWHVARAPQPGSYDRKIDIWLAPKQEWYPVRVRYTEKNGDYIDMSLSSISSGASR